MFRVVQKQCEIAATCAYELCMKIIYTPCVQLKHIHEKQQAEVSIVVQS